jgi:hypothetical protein
MSHHKGVKVRNACNAAVDAFKKVNKPEYADIQSKLEFCIGSYDFDSNPEGLYEYGKTALGMLKEIKKTNPRKVNKKVIDDLEESLAE